MDRSTTRYLGLGTVIGAVLGLLCWIPEEWYGVRDSGAYMFTPEPFAPLWISRVLVPYLGTLSLVLVLLGVYALSERDGEKTATASRVAIVGLTMLAVAALLYALIDHDSLQRTNNTLVVFIWLYVLFGVYPISLLTLGSLFGMGIQYLEVDYRPLGLPLTVGPAVSMLLVVSSIVFVDFGPLPLFTVLATTAGAIGVDLWRHPGPISATQVSIAASKRESSEQKRE